jgi:formate dehydrogenase iron-sulfur subunit
MRQAIESSRRHGLLGPSLLGSAFAFDMEVRVGAGAYVCGEETSMLESLEGRRGEVRAKPPLPAHVGLFGMPTIINNVLTLAAVPYILTEGAKAYPIRHGRSRGTMPSDRRQCQERRLFGPPSGSTRRAGQRAVAAAPLSRTGTCSPVG